MLEGVTTTGNVAQGNTILANAYGVEIRGGSANNTIGGKTAALGNNISGNVADGVTVYGLGSSGNTIQENILHGNGQFGVSAYASDNSVVGNTIDSNARKACLSDWVMMARMPIRSPYSATAFSTMATWAFFWIRMA